MLFLRKSLDYMASSFKVFSINGFMANKLFVKPRSRKINKQLLAWTPANNPSLEKPLSSLSVLEDLFEQGKKYRHQYYHRPLVTFDLSNKSLVQEVLLAKKLNDINNMMDLVQKTLQEMRSINLSNAQRRRV